MGIGASASDSVLSLLPGEADGFLQSVLGSVPTEVSLSGKITWSSNLGAALDGLPGTTFVIPINQRIATVELKTAVISFKGVPGGFAATAAFSGNSSLGPLSVAVQNVGLTLQLVPVGANYELEVLFKPPAGLGASLDAGPITGGGFLSIDTPNGFGPIRRPIRGGIVYGYGSCRSGSVALHHRLISMTPPAAAHHLVSGAKCMTGSSALA